MSHIAFERNPSECRGVLLASNFQPLTLQGVLVEIEVHDFTARIHFHAECKNTTNEAQEVFAAITAVPNWVLSSMRCDLANQFVSSVVGRETVSAPLVLPESESFVPTVYTQAVPFPLLVGQSVVVSAVFYAPLTLVGADVLELLVPKSLFPERIDPLQTAAEYATRFEIRGASTKLSRSVFMNVRGSLVDSLKEAPEIRSGTNAVGTFTKETFSAKWESHAHNLKVEQDLLLHLKLAPSADPLRVRVWKDVATKKEGQAGIDPRFAFAGVATLVPAFTTEQSAVVNAEMIFMIDSSASMLPHWDSVIAALKLAIAGLPSTTYINIVAFNNSLTYLFPNGSELLTQAVADHIFDEFLPLQLKTPTTADAKLYSAVQHVYGQMYITGFVRNIILVTDSPAEAHLASRCIDIGRANTHSTRFSVIGLGLCGDDGFFSLMVSESNGIHRHAKANADVSRALLDVVHQVHVPTLVHVVARTQYDQTPDEKTPLVICSNQANLSCVPIHTRAVIPFFGSSDLHMFTFVVSGLIGLHHIDFKAHSSDLKNQDHQSMSELGNPLRASIAHVASAIDRIQRLSEGNDKSLPAQAEIDEMVTLSSDFLVPSPSTEYLSSSSLNALKTGNRAITALRHISKGRHIKAALEVAAAHRGTSRDATGLKAVNMDEAYRVAVAERIKSNQSVETKAFVEANVVSEIVRLVCGNPCVEDVLLSQEADGSFKPCAKLFAGIGLSEEHLLSRAPQDSHVKLWTTALALTALERANESVSNVVLTNLAIKKARDCLRLNQGESLVTNARRLLQV